MIYNSINQLNQDLPKEGRIMGLDIGTKTIGIAISDLSRIIATPKITLSRKGNQKDFPLLAKFMAENSIIAIIIGLPLNMDDSESTMSAFIRRFAGNFDQFSTAKMAFFDERLSSFEAEESFNIIQVRHNKRKELIDQIAAGVILQSALDHLNN
jgi:putative Holliday junction resolvase